MCSEAALTRRFDAVLFDLDGILTDSEPWWNDVRREFARAHGRPWTLEDQHAVMGGNTREWSRTMRSRLDLPHLTEEAIADAIVDGVVGLYRSRPSPVIAGAPDVVRRVAGTYPVAIASSAHLRIIEAAVDALGLHGVFGALVSADEVAEGKPAPDVYLRAAEHLGTHASRCMVVEDSTNGAQAGRAAGAFVVLVPNPSVPPGPAAFEAADLVIASLAELDPERAAS